MSVGGSSARFGISGRYGIVGHPDGAASPLGQVKEMDDGTRRRELVDEELLDEESRKALEAEDFVIFGRASVEKYDEDHPPQKLRMEALAKALPQLFEDGIISRRHKDIPVGEVLAEHTLEEATKVEVGGDTLRFDAGETLKTQIVEAGEQRPGSAGAAPEDEFWIVANLKSNSEIAKETRLRALAGDLNGFSVTIYAKEWVETEKGQEVTELDWHAVTIGEEHKIKNKDSRFGVAEFKAFFQDALPDALSGAGSDEAGSGVRDLAEAVHTKANTTMSNEFNGQLFMKAGSDLGFDEARLQGAAALAEKADGTDEEALREKADEIAEEHDQDPDDLVETAKLLAGEPGQKEVSEDVEGILKAVEEELGEEAAKALRQELKADDEDDEDEPDEEESDGEMKGDGDDEDDEDEPGSDEKSGDGGGISVENIEGDVVTKSELEEFGEDLKSEMVSEDQIEDLKGDLEETTKSAINEALPGIVEDVGEKMATGETPSPAGGSTHDQVDYTEDIQGAFSPQGGD